MNNQEFVIESFISFCDDMIIAEEGFKDIIDKLIELLKKVVYGIQKKFNKDIILIDKAYVDEFEDVIKEMDLAKNGIKTAKVNRVNLTTDGVVNTGKLAKISKKHVLHCLMCATSRLQKPNVSSDVVSACNNMQRIANLILTKGR